MVEKRWYYVQDDYGHVWNEEPFTTFAQANYYKGMVRELVFESIGLHVRSCPRDGAPETPTIVRQQVPKKDRYADSDF